VVEDEKLHARGVGHLGGLHRRGVVVGDVVHDLRHPRAVRRLGGRSDARHQVVGLGLVHEHVGAARRLDQGVRAHGVAAHHHRAAAVLEAVAVGRPHRRVVDGEGRHRQALRLEGRGGALARGGARHGAGAHGARLGRQQVRAVMLHPVAHVEGVGLGEARHHPLDPGRPDHGEGPGSPAHPALEVPLAELSDVVRVEVGEEDGAEAAGVHAPQGHLVGRAQAGVHQVEAPPGEDRHAGPGAAGMGQGRGRAAEQHPQGVVGEEGVGPLGHLPGDGPLHHPVLHRRDPQRHEDHRGEERRRRERAPDQPAHAAARGVAAAVAPRRRARPRRRRTRGGETSASARACIRALSPRRAGLRRRGRRSIAHPPSRAAGGVAAGGWMVLERPRCVRDEKARPSPSRLRGDL